MNNPLYVLVEEQKHYLKIKKILGIYDYEKGIEQIKILQNINLEKIYTLEGPFMLQTNNHLIYPNIPFITPKPHFPIIKSPNIFPDPFDKN